MSKLKTKSISFAGEIDDSFMILVKQNTSEFVLIHNNITDCKCLFCKKFMKAIIGVFDK